MLKSDFQKTICNILVQLFIVLLMALRDNPQLIWIFPHFALHFELLEEYFTASAPYLL